MNWNRWIRQFHRWVSIAFVVVAIIVTVLSSRPTAPPEWVFLVPLLPLAFLALSGLYLFALPYAARWRGEREPDRANPRPAP